MKKFLIAAIAAAALVVGLAPSASATNLPSVPNGWQLKVDICHNGTVVPVPINAAQTQDTGHGELTLANLDLDGNVFFGTGFGADASFVAHVGPGGHANDSALRVYLKKGKDEINLDVLADACSGPEGPAGPPGEDGEDGEDGRTPTVLCAPGRGLSFTFDSEFNDTADLYVLEEGEICPLAGKNGNDGADGSDGTDGVNGTNGTDGTTGPAGPSGPAGADGTTVTYIACSDGTVVGLGATCPVGTTPVTQPTPAEAPSGELPHTGTSATMWLTIIGLGAGALGLLFRRFSRAAA